MRVKNEKRAVNQLRTQTYVNIKIIISPKTRTLLHISAINLRPQRDVWRKL